MSPTAIDDPCRLFRPRPFPERLWAFLCAPATGVADRLKGGRLRANDSGLHTTSEDVSNVLLTTRRSKIVRGHGELSMPIRSVTGRSLGLNHPTNRLLPSYPAIVAWERMASGILDRVRSEIRALKQEIAAIETLCDEQRREPGPRRAA
jgi:hypothetical protein